MSRLQGLVLILASSLILSACVDSLHSQTPSKWTTGFWYWHQDSAQPASAKEIPDDLYVHAGRIQKAWSHSGPAGNFVNGEIPGSLPPARQYWLVFRAEEQGVPDLAAVAQVIQEISRLVGDARDRRLRIAGVQLDIDCPTHDLPHYAEFLRAVRNGMPAGLRLSITGLLDWFRDGTSIGDVVKQTDEFVPQFYDVDPPGSFNEWRAIAAPIDAAKWAPHFNRLGKPYRIGISTFGRARFVSTRASAPRLYNDVTPLDFARFPAFALQTSHTDAGELILRYQAQQKNFIGYTSFEPGDAVEFTLATPDSIRTAVKSARQMGGNCAGVVFFRWPAANETLVMQPDNAISAAGLAANAPPTVRIGAIDGGCAAVSCVDLFLQNGNPLESHAVRYRVHSSVNLEYFLPDDKMPVRMTGPSELEIDLPPYGGENNMELGRAVSKNRADFQIEELP